MNLRSLRGRKLTDSLSNDGQEHNKIAYEQIYQVVVVVLGARARFETTFPHFPRLVTAQEESRIDA